MYQNPSAWSVVKVPVNGRFPAGELTRKDPQLLVTSAILVGTEARSHIAPPKYPLRTLRRLLPLSRGGRPLGTGPKGLRRPPQPTKVRGPPAFLRQFFLVELSGARWVLPATGYIARQPKGRMRSGRVLLRLRRLL